MRSKEVRIPEDMLIEIIDGQKEESDGTGIRHKRVGSEGNGRFRSRRVGKAKSTRIVDLKSPRTVRTLACTRFG